MDHRSWLVSGFGPRSNTDAAGRRATLALGRAGARRAATPHRGGVPARERRLPPSAQLEPVCGARRTGGSDAALTSGHTGLGPGPEPGGQKRGLLEVKAELKGKGRARTSLPRGWGGGDSTRKEGEGGAPGDTLESLRLNQAARRISRRLPCASCRMPPVLNQRCRESAPPRVRCEGRRPAAWRMLRYILRGI